MEIWWRYELEFLSDFYLQILSDSDSGWNLWNLVLIYSNEKKFFRRERFEFKLHNLIIIPISENANIERYELSESPRPGEV